MSVDPSPIDAKEASVMGNNQRDTQQSRPPQGCSPQNYPPQEYPTPGYQVLSRPIQECPSQSYPMAVIIVQPQAVYDMQQAAVLCQWCGAQVVTETTYRSGIFAGLLAVMLFLYGCVAGCCLIPFCINYTKDVVHSCPNCHMEIGRWNRL